MNVCPNDAPVELADGTILQPEDTVRVKDLCEIVPLILETLQASAAGAPGAKGQVTPGAPVPVVGRMPGFTSPVAPGFGSRPGAIAPAQGFGQQGQGGGMGGFGGGGGGRGSPGPAGPAGATGPAGPAGPGSLLDYIYETNLHFTAMGALVPVPGFFVDFIVKVAGPVEIIVSANIHNLGGFNAEITLGINVNGQDFSVAHLREINGSAGDELDRFPLIGVLPVTLPAGNYRAQGLFTSGTHSPYEIEATPEHPAVITVKHS